MTAFLIVILSFKLIGVVQSLRELAREKPKPGDDSRALNVFALLVNMVLTLWAAFLLIGRFVPFA